MPDEQELTGWDPFLRWAPFFFGTSAFDFEYEEREYKVQAVAPFIEARAALDGGDWLPLVSRGFKNKNANLVSHWQFTPFLDWSSRESEIAAKALAALWQSTDAAAQQRLDAFDALVPSHVLSGQGIRCNLAAYLLSSVDPYGWPNYKVTATELACELTRYPPPGTDCSLGARYEHALDFFDEMIHQAGERGFRLRDRLDAQGLLWCIAGGALGDKPANFSREEWEQFLAFRTIPSAWRKEQRRSTKRAPVVQRRPPHPVCPICGNDDEVRLQGALDDGWLFVCEVGPRHPMPFEPLEFRGS